MQTQLLNPANRRIQKWPSPLFRTCLNEVIRFLPASFHTVKAKGATFFGAKVLSLYQCFQRGQHLR